MNINKIHFIVFLSEYAMIDLGPFMDRESIHKCDDRKRLLLSVRHNELAVLAREDMKCCLTESGNTLFQGAISEVRPDQDRIVIVLKKESFSKKEVTV